MPVTATRHARDTRQLCTLSNPRNVLHKQPGQRKQEPAPRTFRTKHRQAPHTHTAERMGGTEVLTQLINRARAKRALKLKYRAHNCARAEQLTAQRIRANVILNRINRHYMRTHW